MFKRLLVALAVMAFAIVGLSFSPAQAAPSTKANQPQCFSDPSSTCTRSGSTFILTNTTEGSGVYVENQSLAGKPLSEAGVLSFRYSGTVGGGSPRFAIPVDDPSDGINPNGYDFFLAAQATYCDANNDGVVSLAEPVCVVEAPGFFGLFSDYVALHPDYLIGSYYTFIVTDVPGTVTISEINLARVAPGKVKK
jgi:hypothetical protein